MSWKRPSSRNLQFSKRQKHQTKHRPDIPMNETFIDISAITFRKYRPKEKVANHKTSITCELVLFSRRCAKQIVTEIHEALFLWKVADQRLESCYLVSGRHFLCGHVTVTACSIHQEKLIHEKFCAHLNLWPWQNLCSLIRKLMTLCQVYTNTKWQHVTVCWEILYQLVDICDWAGKYLYAYLYKGKACITQSSCASMFSYLWSNLISDEIGRMAWWSHFYGFA